MLLVNVTMARGHTPELADQQAQVGREAEGAS